MGVIATEATIKSGFFQKALKDKNPSLDVEAKACPLFVPLVEEGWSNNAITARIAEAYLREWKETPIDLLILGCTHYPLLSPTIQQILRDTVLIDVTIATVKILEKYLTSNHLLNESGKIFQEFYVSGDVEKFNVAGKKITDFSIQAQKVYW